MADTQKTTKVLNLTMKFEDDDDRIMSVDNPISDDDELKTKILALQTDMATNQQFVGDKTGASFSHFSKAIVKNQTVTKLDLN